MTASDSAKAAPFLADSPAAKPFIRERLGLEVEHLLPGLDIAAERLRRGDGQDALRIYAALVLCDPREPRFQIGLATCALRIGLHAVALRAASAVIALMPGRPEGYHLSGHACMGLEDRDAAARDFADALRLAGDAGLPDIARDSECMLARLAAMRGGAAPAQPRRPIAASA